MQSYSQKNQHQPQNSAFLERVSEDCPHCDDSDVTIGGLYVPSCRNLRTEEWNYVIYKQLDLIQKNMNQQWLPATHKMYDPIAWSGEVSACGGFVAPRGTRFFVLNEEKLETASGCHRVFCCLCLLPVAHKIQHVSGNVVSGWIVIDRNDNRLYGRKLVPFTEPYPATTSGFRGF